jgi:hypothetical protein
MKQIDKKTINKFGEHYLLGVNKDGEHVYLEKESWDCGWYWGAGYLHTFTNDRVPTASRDIAMHTHFDSLFLNKNVSAYDLINSYFESMVISKDQLYELVDLMMTMYDLKKTAELFRHGYSYQTEKAKIEDLKDEALENRINKVLLPQVFDRIRKLLTEEN